MSFAPVSRAEAPAAAKKPRCKQSDDEADWRVGGGLIAASAALAGILGFFRWAEFLRPFSIVGTWQGSKLDYEIGKMIKYAHYRLILDERHRAALTLQQELTLIGTYQVKGDRLKLHVASDTRRKTWNTGLSWGACSCHFLSPRRMLWRCV